jgi:hypothetical protein
MCTAVGSVGEGETNVMSFGLYLLGYVILCVGLLIGAHLLHVPPRWLGVGALVLIGIGIVTAVTKTRTKDN